MYGLVPDLCWQPANIKVEFEPKTDRLEAIVL